MRVGIHYHTIELESRLRYVLDFIESHPLAKAIQFSINKNESINLFYGKKKKEGFDFYITPQEKLFSSRESVRFSSNRYKQSDQLLHSVEPIVKETDHFITDGGFGFDLFETIFFHLSRVEEIGLLPDLLNDRGQIKETEIFVVKNKIEKIPHVDRIVGAFVRAITKQEVEQETSHTITHDIDFIEKYKSPLSFLNFTARTILNSGKLKPLVSQYLNSRKEKIKDPYNIFSGLLRKEQNISKRIYFLVGGKHKYDNSYSLAHPTFLEAIKLSKERDYEIGIHPSYEAWKSMEMILSEKAKLQKAIQRKITISRQHYLHFDILETPSALLAAGIEEDSSIGFTQRIGFKSGTGFPYFLYDFKTEKPSKLLEYPLVYMDSSAINESKETTMPLEELTKAFLLTNAHNTHLCFNFHNSRMDDSLAEGRLIEKIYSELFV